ncbi:MAG TPA: hypothetical protein ENI23_11760 [bacterium]|nr:hypothetical protein [bacterium]
MACKELKPKAKIINSNGNIFNLLAIAGQALFTAGYPEKKKEMLARVKNCHSYDEALRLIMEYIEPVYKY